VHLLMARSENGGANWSQPVDLLAYEWSKDIENPMLGADAKTGKLFLFFTMIDRHSGGCDEGILTESGFQLVTSTDRGVSWGPITDVQKTLPDKFNGLRHSWLNHSLPCGRSVSPTVGTGIQLQRGAHAGRMLFGGQTDADNGSLVLYSDDGEVWDWTDTLHFPGNDETSVAETRNGSVMAIMRNCITKDGTSPNHLNGTADDCVGTSHHFNAAWSTDGKSTPANLYPLFRC
jgi:hypothetical protein